MDMYKCLPRDCFLRLAPGLRVEGFREVCGRPFDDAVGRGVRVVGLLWGGGGG